MKKIILVGVLVGLLTGCDETYSEKQPVSNFGDKPLIVYQVNGKPLECVHVGTNGRTCNWEKHNKLFEGGVSQ